LIEQQVDEQGEPGHQVKEGGQVAKIGDDRSTDNNPRWWRNSVNAERSLRQTDPVEQNLIDDHGEAERGNRKVVPAQPHCEKGQEHPGQTRERNACNERGPERNAKLDDQQGRNVGAETIKGGMTEIELPGIAQDEIKAEREQDVDGADRQVRAPIGIIEYQRQRDDAERGKQISHPPRSQHLVIAYPLRNRGIRHSLRAFPRSAQSA
jgi:hypothetical protein